MKSYKARGIVLHTMRYGENALIVFMLTDLLGRQNYLIQGVKSTKSHSKTNKAALFQPMFLVDFVGLESPKIQMHRIKEASGTPPKTIPFDPRKSTIALFMAEVLYRLVRETEPHSPLFDFVIDTVTTLDTLTEGVANFHLWFLVRLSFHLGFYPGNEHSANTCFDIKEGVFKSTKPTHPHHLDTENSRTLGLLMSLPAAELDTLKLSRIQRTTFLAAMLTYFGYHLDAIHNVKSLEILRDVF